jgi:hypothetical protein
MVKHDSRSNSASIHSAVRHPEVMKGLKAFSMVLLALASATASAQGGSILGQDGRIVGDAEEFEQQLFLSPSDRSEWIFDAKEGEGVLVQVSSSVFDPAVAALDEAGRTLMENDDAAPGDQRARILFQPPQPGRFRIAVTNFKGTAGGAFTFHVVRFRAVDAPMGGSARIAVGDQRAWARAEFSQPGAYSLSTAGGSMPVALVGPDGSQAGPAAGYEAQDGRWRLQIPKAGAYYLRFGTPGPTVSLAPIPVQEVRLGEKARVHLEPARLVDLRLRVPAGQVVRYALPPGTTPARSRAGFAEDKGSIIDQGGALNQVLLRAREETDLTVTVWSSDPGAADFNVVFEDPRQAMSPDGFEGALGWHGRDVLAFDARIGDVIQLRGRSPGYEVSLALISPSGTMIAAERASLDGIVAASLNVTESGQYLALVRGGGIGPYRVEKELAPVREIRGRDHDGPLDAGRPEVWRWMGSSGEDFAFRITSEGAPCRVIVIDPAGRAIAQMRPGNDFFRLQVREEGPYTFIIQGEGANGRYRFKWIDLNG